MTWMPLPLLYSTTQNQSHWSFMFRVDMRIYCDGEDTCHWRKIANTFLDLSCGSCDVLHLLFMGRRRLRVAFQPGWWGSEFPSMKGTTPDLTFSFPALIQGHQSLCWARGSNTFLCTGLSGQLPDERRRRFGLCWGLAVPSLQAPSPWPLQRVESLLPRVKGLGSSSFGLGESLLLVRDKRGDGVPSSWSERVVSWLRSFIWQGVGEGEGEVGVERPPWPSCAITEAGLCVSVGGHGVFGVLSPAPAIPSSW